MARPTLHLRITERRVRVELDGAGVLFDEEAAVALRYDARLHEAQIFAGFDDAVTVKETLTVLAREGEIDDGDNRAFIVPLPDAPWFEHLRSLASSSDDPPTLADPWEHHGEIVIVHPFAEVTLAPLLWLPLLEAAHRRALQRAAADRRLRRLWLEHWARVAIDLPALPEDAAIHDELVRHLRDRFGARVMLDGARARLRAPMRLADLSWQQWVVAVTPLVAGVAMAWPPRRFLPAPYALLGGVSLSALLLLDMLQKRPPARPPRALPLLASAAALRRYADSGRAPGARAYAGRGSFRLEVTDSFGGVLQGIIALLVTMPIGLVLLRSRLHGALVMSLGLGMLALGASLGTRLASARVAVGERGITVRYRGWLGGSLRIPFTRIRRVIAGGSDAPRLRIFFHDGRELSLGFTWATEERVRVLREIEALITPQITPPGSYRAPGGRTAA